MAQFQPTPQTGSEPPLDWPWYGIGFGAAVKRFFKKYATFSGRASRGEYWWYALFSAIIGVVFYAVLLAFALPAMTTASSGGTPRFGAGYYAISGLLSLWGLATLVPSLALAWRRLHDTGRSGWNYLFVLIPIAGPIILLVFFASQTTQSAEQYGPPTSQPAYGYGQQSYPPEQGYTGA
ncbi:MAG TPA: DUF805 domain-containing protein [Friedmanniella sp.]